MRPSDVLRLLVSALLIAAAALATAACDGKGPASSDPGKNAKTEGPAMTFALTSPAFKNDARIPKQYTGEGTDLSPPLEWTATPEGVKAFALICDDPDAPRGTWDHWILWNIPADRAKLPEGVARTETLPDLGGARQGRNSWPKTGYNGPMPPPGHGTHHYHLVLYALDTVLDLKPGADKKALLAAMDKHVLGKATLTGTYSR